MPDFRAELRVRLATVRLEPSREAEIIEELAQHLDDRHAELVAGGARPEAAAAALLAEVDDGLLARELARVRPAGPPLAPPGAPRRALVADLVADLRYAVRALAKSRLFTAVTLVSLTLGIGANAALFQLLDALSLRRLPVARPDELAFVRIHDRHWGAGSFSSNHPELTNPLWEQIRDRQQAFSSIAAFSDTSFNVGELRPRALDGLMVSGSFFDVLEVRPELGRLLGPDDDRRGCGAAVAVVSHRFWQDALAGDPGVVGRSLRLDGRAFTVVGVVPPAFTGLEVGKSFGVAVPLCTEALFNGQDSVLDLRWVWWLAAVGRLKPGFTLEKADAHILALSPGLLEATVPPTYRPEYVAKYLEYRIGAEPAAHGVSNLREEYATPLYLLLGIAGLVLLIACANLANLLLARASAREREIAVRLALGASRGRLVRQLMVESLLLAVVGAALGLLLAHLLSGVLVGLIGTSRDELLVDLSLDGRVLAFTAGLAGATCVLFGLAPALRASRTDVGLVLKATSGHGATAGRDRFTLRRFLVIAQVAMSFVLLAMALLFARTLRNVVGVDPGFHPGGVVIAGADLSPLRLSKERRRALPAELLERLRAVPGVEAASVAAVVPMSGSSMNRRFELGGAGGRMHESLVNQIADGYFAALGTPILLGRDFTAADRAGGPPVAIVSQRMARELAGADSPIGKRLHLQAGSRGGAPIDLEVVGVVGDSKFLSLRDEIRPIVYLAFAQDDEPSPGMQIVVRARAQDAALVAGVRRAALEAAPGALLQFDGMARMVDDSVQRDRLMATLSGFFGVLAAVLATVGLYGVVAYSVARRRHEIGIRLALGADGRRIGRMIVGETLRLLGAGVAAGLVLSLGATRLAGSLLYGLGPNDPSTLALAAAVLGAIAVAASLLPARRAARVDPMLALRDE